MTNELSVTFCNAYHNHARGTTLCMLEADHKGPHVCGGCKEAFLVGKDGHKL